jgi:hypothetical protein
MTFANPFQKGGNWFRGNIHTHTTESDGRLSPSEVSDFYRTRGYDFLILTDHDRVSDPSGLSTEDFLVFSGVEIGPMDTRHHIVGVGIGQYGPVEKWQTAQETIDGLRGMGALVFIAHPYWSALTESDIGDLQRIIGIELYNTGCEVEIGRGFSTVHWDNLLASGMALDGIAVDDAHRYTDDAPGGWVWVKASRLTEERIIDSLSKGLFYATTGPRIIDIEVKDETIRVESSPVDTITFHSRGPSGDSVHRVGEGMLTHATHQFKPDHRYVRVECVDGGGRKAWSNPIYTETFGSQ